jgi:steroid 5-alpha reductase family enzyme
LSNAAATFKFDKVTDLAGGTNFVWLSIITWALGHQSPRHTAVNILVIAWGIRLAGYLFMRILLIGEDKRFDKMRENPWEFAVFWIFQFFWVWIVMFPVMSLNDTKHVPDLNYSDYIGIALASGGLIIETIADHTKFTFK